MSLIVWGIAIPFLMVEPTSLPLSVGILCRLMWLPVSWLLQHWNGYFQAGALLLVAAHYLFPQHRYLVIPLIIVAVYAVTIVVLEQRWRRLRGAQ